jgi:hypothetical protein
MLTWRDPGSLPADMALGQRWGSWRIVGYALDAVPPGLLVVCRCGEVGVMPEAEVRRATRTDYGVCSHRPARLPSDMALGHPWGCLTIVGYEQRQHTHQWRTCVYAVCQCGHLRRAEPTHLRKRRVVSCGCHSQEASRQRMQRVWEAVRAGERTVRVGRKKHQQEEAA